MSLDPIKQKNRPKLKQVIKLEKKEEIPGPAKKIKKRKKSTNKTADKKRNEKADIVLKIPNPLKTELTDQEKKVGMWILVGVALMIIIFFWVNIFPASINIKNPRVENNPKNLWTEIKFLWQDFQDRLPTPTPSNYENKDLPLTNQEIKKLEEKIFE